MNLNKLAVELTRREGGKVNLTIAQAKECLKHTLDILAVAAPVDVLILLRKRLRKIAAQIKKTS